MHIDIVPTACLSGMLTREPRPAAANGGTLLARRRRPQGRRLPFRRPGGLAYSEFFIRNSYGFAWPLIGDNGVQGGAATATKAGWTLGAGFEFPVCERVTFKTEYLYSEFGGVSTPYAYNEVWSPNFYGALGSMQSGTLGVHMVRAGFNWQLR
jgi:opacity protein-like surface antigen